MDFILSLLAIIVLSPVLLVVVILVRVKLGSPIIFKQKRPGLNEKIFTMYKFRTMTDERDENGKLKSDKVRLTKFGKMLRSTSLDELPELFNILFGDMSIVGPRPQLVRDMVFMTSEQRRRHIIRPGLTGLAQVNGRNKIEWEDKLFYDKEYIETITFQTDTEIVLKTFIKVINKVDVNTEDMETSEDFGDYLLRTGRISQNVYLDRMNICKNITKDKQVVL
jgi:lipopolysaccharide/colanic/teichoic acid biosynthesis glycosyltransferase